MHKRKMIGCAAALLALGILSGCEGGRTVRAASVPLGGDAKRGHDVIVSKGCGSCHTIPGVAAANGLVGPPLFYFSRRTYVAGMLPNNPENLAKWVKAPESVVPGVAMPNLGLTDQQARDVAAYLDTLK